MKTLLTTTAILITVGVMGASDSASAASVQPIAPVYQTNHIQPVWWRGGHRWGHHWGWGRGWGYHPYRHWYWHHPRAYWYGW